jgi:hypothetical protein
MKLLDSTMQYALPALGFGLRWMKEELQARHVNVPLTDTSLRELVADAYAAARLPASGSETVQPYTSRLRHELAERADFVRAWTLSDDRVDLDKRNAGQLVRIARKYALPRAWRLSEPVAAPSRRPTPTYLYWSSVTH